MTDDTITVKDGIAASTVTLLFRQIGLFITGGTAMLGFARHHDIGGFVTWAQTSDGATSLSLAATLVLAAWGQRHNLAQKFKLINAARDPRNAAINLDDKTGAP